MHSTDDKEKNVIKALIIANMTQRYQAVDVVAIITRNVRGSRTNRLKCNQIFTLGCFSSIHFEPVCLSLKEVRAQKNKISMLLCTCGLTCTVQMFDAFGASACLLLFPPQIEPDNHVQYLVIEHNCTKNPGRASNALAKQSFSICKPFHDHPAYVMGSSN